MRWKKSMWLVSMNLNLNLNKPRRSSKRLKNLQVLHDYNNNTSWSCAGVNLPAKSRFDCGWIMWQASKHVLTEKTNFAFSFIKIKV